MVRTRLAVALALLWLAPAAAQAASVTLAASPEPEQFAGSAVTLQASATFDGGGQPVYQFAYRASGGAWRLLSDFFERSTFQWVTLEEGTYEVRVVARIRGTAESAQAIRSYTIRSRAQSAPVLAPTGHPLVAIYSAPACNEGWMRVRFKHRLALYWQFTQFQACSPGKALNFYVAGLRGDSGYIVQQQVFPPGGAVVEGAQMALRTGTPVGTFNPVTVTLPPQPGASVYDTTVLHSFVGQSNSWFPVATDLGGAVTWYYPKPITSALRPVAGGMLVLVREDVVGRVIREIDLAGNIVRETNTTTVSEQLAEIGQDPIGVFHHEALRLANGHTLVLASVERILTDVQGPGPVNVYGEMVVDLDENLQVAWAWNAFDFLDPSRQALLGETCTFEAPGCPALFLAPNANDWLHANSIAYIPEDHNLLVSLRHQDWVIKIDYRDGAGTGAVIWRLGPGGDFTLTAPSSAGPWPWFSHQHDAKMGGGVVLLFDNGNLRVEGPDGIGGNSRGQALRLDQAAMTATLVFNHDLGGYSSALGSAQRLTNGNLYFGNGFLGDQANPSSEGTEVALDGSARFTIRADGFTYRSLRLRDFYRP